MRNRKHFLAMLLLLSMSAAVRAASNSPIASVQTVIDQAMAVFKDKSIAPADREKKLRALGEAHFDFQKMARTAVGLHWRDFSEQQRAEFVPLFTNFIEDVYLSRMEQYSVEKVQQ
ncbi:MAG TPA: ABC transporter substrate-binding protein, partial [Candidatus Binataceae bacterium]|nr:ABC transporter substrate-binding protein [Candidatus Binataceae bacterium]